MLDNDKIFRDILYRIGDENKTEMFSPHVGYPNLFPFALGIIDPTDIELITA